MDQFASNAGVDSPAIKLELWLFALPASPAFKIDDEFAPSCIVLLARPSEIES